MRAAARGARRPSRTSAVGRWAWLWRPPRRASSPSAGWSAGVRLLHRARAWSGAAAPPRRTAASRGRVGPGATSMRTATRTRDDSASQMRRNRRSERGLSLPVIRASRRVARPTPGGAKSACPRRGTLTGAVCCLYHRRRQPGSLRLPRKLFLNPAPLGCHHHLHLSRLSTLALAVSLRVGAGDTASLVLAGTSAMLLCGS